jgi:3',5'-cyclic AMP phosphodiesterase CpdA
VDEAALSAWPARSPYGLRNLLRVDDLRSCLRGGRTGLTLDLSALAVLLDGTPVEGGRIHGRVHFGAYPFTAARTGFKYKRFARVTDIREGKAELKLERLFGEQNSEGWKEEGRLALRLELFYGQEGRDKVLGVYDVHAAFRRVKDGYERVPWLTEGPFVARLDSRRPGEATIAFKAEAPAEVVLDDGRVFKDGVLTGLKPDTEYRYRIRVGSMLSSEYRFRTAPKPGADVVLAFTGDSREGAGGGQKSFMGVNYETLERLLALAYGRGARSLLHSGDVVNGFTDSKADIELQLYASKQSMAGFWHERPVYAVMGNHETLVRAYDLGGEYPVGMDRWPYAVDSSEAVFGREFPNPEDAPAPADPRLPPYKGSVFTVQFGAVRVIAFNNNHWYSGDAAKFGGAPEGYILEDQLSWIEKKLEEAEKDASVRHVLLLCHQPPFPVGPHVKDAMWYGGDNKVRAARFSDGMLKPEKLGIVDVRNRLALATAGAEKVAAVLASHDHSYYRVYVDSTVPAGIPAVDDKDNDGRIAWDNGEPASPLPVRRGVWYIVAGGGGAPYYGRTYPSPWTDRARGFSPQEGVVLIRESASGISFTLLNAYGEVLDELKVR